MTYMVGTPNNLAIRDTLDEECVPQLFNSTGFPAWGDPKNYPWTIGGILAYNTEADLWCNYIEETRQSGSQGRRAVHGQRLRQVLPGGHAEVR